VKGDWDDLYGETEPEEYRPLEPHPPAAASAPAKRSDGLILVNSVLISVVIMIGTLAVYDRYCAQKIVALDVKGYIAEQRDLYLNGKINEEQLKENFDRLEKAKERVPKNRVIILGDVLVRKNVEEIKP
jgi:hypothetical protein